jgi:hypothetical protein
VMVGAREVFATKNAHSGARVFSAPVSARALRALRPRAAGAPAARRRGRLAAGVCPAGGRARPCERAPLRRCGARAGGGSGESALRARCSRRSSAPTPAPTPTPAAAAAASHAAHCECRRARVRQLAARACARALFAKP